MAPYPDDQEQFEDITASISNEPDDKFHMDSAGEYSIGSSQASMQMAQYLDDVESAGGNDICSFQDVNLNDGGTIQEEEVRRARKRYYLLPMLIRYSLPIGGCLLGFTVLFVAIGVTASVVRSQDEKRMMNMPEIQGDMGVEGFESVGGWDDMFQSDGKFGGSHEDTPGDDGVEEVGDFEVNFYDDMPVYDDATGDEEVGEPLEFESTNENVGTVTEFTSSTDDQDRNDILDDVWTTDDAKLVDGTNSLDDAFDGSKTGEGTGISSVNSGSSGTGTSGGSLMPKWYTTSHPSYVSLLQLHSSVSANVSPHHTAALFCNELGEVLCSYSTYCPSGKGGVPYSDGPDDLFDMVEEEWEQWAPVNTRGQGTEWVQIGKIKGADGEYGGTCRSYSDWSGEEDVQATVASEHRRYILCCDAQNI